MRKAPKPFDRVYRPKSAEPAPGEGCGICGVTGDLLFWDHDHETGEHRGWLCPSCNTGLGALGDDLAGILRAAQYLARAKWGVEVSLVRAKS